MEEVAVLGSEENNIVRFSNVLGLVWCNVFWGQRSVRTLIRYYGRSPRVKK